MPSIAVIASGLVVLVAGGWAFLHPQRFYDIRQRGQTDASPQLSAAGTLKWRILHAVFALLGAAIALYGLTM